MTLDDNMQGANTAPDMQLVACIPSDLHADSIWVLLATCTAWAISLL